MKNNHWKITNAAPGWFAKMDNGDLHPVAIWGLRGEECEIFDVTIYGWAAFSDGDRPAMGLEACEERTDFNGYVFIPAGTSLK